MAKAKILTMKKATRRQRMQLWYGTHKVLGSVLMLFTLLAIYLGGSQIAVQIQIHQERIKYINMANEMNNLYNSIRASDSSLGYMKTCVHTSFGGVFEVPTRLCNVEIASTHRSIMDAQALVLQLKSMLASKGYSLFKNNNVSQDSSYLQAYNFVLSGFECSLDEHTGNDRFMLVELFCGGRAKADYFPVVKS